jgi:hypothetical protein
MKNAVGRSSSKHFIEHIDDISEKLAYFKPLLAKIASKYTHMPVGNTDEGSLR